MEIRDQEGDVISLLRRSVSTLSQGGPRPWGAGSEQVGRTAVVATHLDRFPPQDEEGLGTLFQEPGELVYQDVLDLVGLLDLDADAHAVDAGLDEDALVLVSRNGQGRQEDLGRCPGLDFGDIVSLGGLGCEVGKAEGRRQAAADGLQVRPKGLRLGGLSVGQCKSMRMGIIRTIL